MTLVVFWKIVVYSKAAKPSWRVRGRPEGCSCSKHRQLEHQN